MVLPIQMKIFLAFLLLSATSAQRHFLRTTRRETGDTQRENFQNEARDPTTLNLKRALFFSGGDDIDNLAPKVDVPLRLLVLVYDLALFPIWLPLIASGGTGGANYQDLFSCVFGQSPFIPCLYSKNLISKEQFTCYKKSGVTWGCLSQGSIVNQLVPK